jgi:hypothetical protein
MNYNSCFTFDRSIRKPACQLDDANAARDEPPNATQSSWPSSAAMFLITTRIFLSGLTHVDDHEQRDGSCFVLR